MKYFLLLFVLCLMQTVSSAQTSGDLIEHIAASCNRILALSVVRNFSPTVGDTLRQVNAELSDYLCNTLPTIPGSMTMHVPTKDERRGFSTFSVASSSDHKFRLWVWDSGLDETMSINYAVAAY